MYDGMYDGSRYVDTPAGKVLLTGSRSEAAAFAASGGCVIGLCAEEDLRTVNFPEASVLASQDREILSEAFIRKTASHHYGKPFTVAQTDRLVIRESVGEDYADIYALLCEQGRRLIPKRDTGQDAELKVKQNTGQDAGPDSEDSRDVQVLADGFDLAEIDTEEKFLQYVNACYLFFGFGVWTVLLRETGNVIGWCGLFPKKDEGEEGFHVELGYAITSSCRGLGYGYEACRAILDYAGEEIGLAKIIIKTDAANTASVALAGKLGFACHDAQRSTGGAPQQVTDKSNARKILTLSLTLRFAADAEGSDQQT